MPKISFVMPTKNRGEIIKASIASVLEQTERDLELIVVDDHSDSSDKTEQVIKTLDDKRIKYVRMLDNWLGGIPAARNFGNMLADSPVIAVTDSDDIYYPKRAEVTLEYLAKENADVFYSDYDIILKETGEKLKRDENCPVIDFDIEALKRYDFIPNGSSAYKREIAYEFPYNSFFRVAQDYDFFSRLAKAGKKFVFCPEKLYAYIVHNESVTRGSAQLGFDKLIHLNRGWSESNREETLEQILGAGSEK